MTTHTRKVARLIALLAFAILPNCFPDAHAAPPAFDRDPGAEHGGLTSTEMTASTIAEFELALGDGDTIESFFAMDAVLTLGETGEHVHGQGAIAQAIEEVFHGTFAGRMTVDARIVSGPIAATSGRLHGEHRGRSINVPVVAIYEVVDAEIVKLRLDYSVGELMRQLAAPGPGDECPNRSGKPC